ncbi:MAG: hypothetical protein CL608_33550 [Anaerolineaceae bacterium]|nr:hypothetical protein [Anaerolineaceae bacterium]
MKHQDKQSAPTEEQIVQLLETTDVPLGRRFHRRMAAMPWMATQSQGDKQMRRSSLNGFGKRLALGLTLVALLMAAFALFTPTGQTMAQEMLRFFQRSSDLPAAAEPAADVVIVGVEADELAVEIPEESEIVVETAVTEDGSQTVTVTGEEDEPVAVVVESEAGSAAVTSSDEIEVTIAEDEDSLTVISSDSSGSAGGGGGIATNNVALSEAAALLGYPVATITNLPAGYALDTVFAPIADMEGASGPHVPTFISLFYRNGTDTILLTQDSKLAADGNVGETIGDNAITQSVEIAPGVTGEYVKGIWVMSEPVQPGTYPLQTAVWDNNAPDQRLTWEANGKRYELKSSSPDLTLADLLQMAQNLAE